MTEEAIPAERRRDWGGSMIKTTMRAGKQCKHRDHASRKAAEAGQREQGNNTSREAAGGRRREQRGDMSREVMQADKRHKRREDTSGEATQTERRRKQRGDARWRGDA
ncbi:hypothetical protein PHLGIDRAFT_17376, partial [Phlebiopsis gigantea 11061_1 CR5-6]